MIGSAVVPIAVCITWRKANGTGAVAGAILGFIAGVAGWLGLTASLNGGVVNVETTFGDYEMLTGNLLAIGVGGIVTVAWSLVKPSDFDWESTRAINRKVIQSQVEVTAATPQDSPSLDVETPGVKEKTGTEAVLGHQVAAEGSAEAQTWAEEEEERVSLQKAFRFAAWAALVLVFVLIFAIPLPLFFSSYGEPASGPHRIVSRRFSVPVLTRQCTRRRASRLGSASRSPGSSSGCCSSACTPSLRRGTDWHR